MKSTKQLDRPMRRTIRQGREVNRFEYNWNFCPGAVQVDHSVWPVEVEAHMRARAERYVAVAVTCCAKGNSWRFTVGTLSPNDLRHETARTRHEVALAERDGSESHDGSYAVVVLRMTTSVGYEERLLRVNRENGTTLSLGDTGAGA